MSNYGPAPHKPDSRTFASYPMPAKVDLINDGRRRESLEEQQLNGQIGGQYGNNFVPRIEVNSPQPSPSPRGYAGHSPINGQQHHQQQHQQQQYNHHQQVETRQVNQQFSRNDTNMGADSDYQFYQQQRIQHHQQPRQVQNFQQNSPAAGPSAMATQVPVQETRSIKTIQTSIIQNKGAIIAAELAEKEAKLMAEIEAFQQRPYSPYQVPAKIDLSNEKRKAQQQFEHAPSRSPRPLSQASSTRSTSADLLDKEAKLMQYIEDIERKPYNPQTMVVEREQWFEYAQDRPESRQLVDSKRRLNDFCSLPAHVYQNRGQHIHEENLPMGSLGRPSSAASSIHTTIIRNPRREVDNKSPLPFAFDNFTTKGVRGNIASAGAIEPDRPRAPIYPIMKRNPSPNMARG